MDIKMNQLIPKVGSVEDLKILSKFWLNLIIYHEVGLMIAMYFEKEFGMPYISIIPMGVVDMDEISNKYRYMNILDPISLRKEVDYELNRWTNLICFQAAWFSRSIDY
eukprot:Gb_22098 [translate_table: standard]